MSTVRFFNLSEPVVPLFRDLGAALIDGANEVEFVVSRSSYRGGDDRLARAVPDAKVIATRGPKRQFENKFGRAFAMLFYWVGACWLILTGSKPTVNVFLTQPPLFAGLGVRLAKLRRQPCVIVVMDLHPDELVSFGVLKEKALVTRFFDSLMTWALRKADAVIVIGRCMRDLVLAKGADASRVIVVPNWVDDTAIVPVERDVNQVRKELGWGDDFVVMYGGNVGYAQQFDTLIEVANKIGADEGIRLAVVGDGSRAAAVKAGMDRASGGEYHPLLHQKYSLGEVLSAADVHFISLREECTGLGVPSKTYAALAAGRPILFEGSPVSEGAGVPSQDADALLASIRELAADRDEWTALCKRSRDVLDEQYTAKHGVERYLEVLRPWIKAASA